MIKIVFEFMLSTSINPLKPLKIKGTEKVRSAYTELAFSVSCRYNNHMERWDENAER